MLSLLDDQGNDCSWLNKPENWTLHNKELSMTTQPKTDFWRKTFYGFDQMNGHAIYKELLGAFETEVTLTMKDPSERYDQAGVMILISDDCWMKVSLEYVPEKYSYLGSVVTNSGFSDWSSKNVPTPEGEISLSFKVTRAGGDYRVWAKFAADEEYEQIRIMRLHDEPNGPVKLGLYACSPSSEGSFTTVFHTWTVQKEVK
ncbi:DUF1349 domain-containing protein [Jeotgalibacillus salarius]|nr:DUF1349 domain-containing protein [Jeotgalibacillus salarius]